MRTTAEEPVTEKQTTDPTIDVELPAATTAQATPSSAAVESTVVGRGRPTRFVRRGNRRTRVTVRRFGLLSVFKFSMIFSLCMSMVVWLALIMIYFVLQAAGVTDTIAYWIGCVVNTSNGTYECTASSIDAVPIFSYLLFALLVTAVVVAVLWTFMALIYNLIADIVGGVEVVLAEKRD
jgi:hypothetical protein